MLLSSGFQMYLQTTAELFGILFTEILLVDLDADSAIRKVSELDDDVSRSEKWMS
jgi:hypothetical protein